VNYVVPISIDEFIKKMAKDSKDLNKKDIKESILAAAERKKNGVGCIQCGENIWAIGSGVTGTDMCFACSTGETDHSEDYELDIVC
jgi:hypothetical protein